MVIKTGNETPMRRLKHSTKLRVFHAFALTFAFWSTAATGAAEPAASTGLTNIFAPESTPAKAIFHFSMFVLAITGIIFVVVFTLILYSFVNHRDLHIAAHQCTLHLNRRRAPQTVSNMR